MKKSEIISHLKERRDNLNAERKKDGIRIDEINQLIRFIREDVKKIEEDELVDVALEDKVTGATAGMLLLELRSQIDFIMSDNNYRNLMIKNTLKGLYEKEKISKAIYEEALNILEN